MPVSSHDKLVHGGNTTCVQVESDCIPSDTVFAIDGGTGIYQCSADNIGKRPKLVIGLTHHHQDHLVGIPMAPHIHVPDAQVVMYGPEEKGWGPEHSMRWLFQRPVFPVEYEQLRHRVKCRKLANPGNQVLVIHPEAGFHLLAMSKYRTAVTAGRQLQLGNRRHDVDECLVVSMYKTTHPDYSISYRFDEKPTGRVFVFLTDHEKLSSHPSDLVAHVRNAHLLIQDGQYTEIEYAFKTAGFGHGTPQYCVDLAIRGEVEKLLLTHHDPRDTDTDIDKKVDDARQYAASTIESKALRFIGAACDYMIIEV